MTVIDPQTHPSTTAAEVAAHLAAAGAVADPTEAFEVRTGWGEVFTVDLASHLLAHLRADPTVRPGTPSLRDRDGDFDADAAAEWIAGMAIDELIDLHASWHEDQCTHCGEPVVASHLSMGAPTMWVHEDGSRRCGEGVEANPSRHPHRFATVNVSMRLRLPAALGPDPDPEAVLAYVQQRHVSYFADTYDPDLAARPSEVLSTEVAVTDIGATPGL